MRQYVVYFPEGMSTNRRRYPFPFPWRYHIHFFSTSFSTSPFHHVSSCLGDPLVLSLTNLLSHIQPFILHTLHRFPPFTHSHCTSDLICSCRYQSCKYSSQILDLQLPDLQSWCKFLLIDETVSISILIERITKSKATYYCSHESYAR